MSPMIRRNSSRSRCLRGFRMCSSLRNSLGATSVADLIALARARSGQAHLCVAGRRLDRLPDGQAVRDESGCPDGARAVSRRRARAHRHRRRPRRYDVRYHRDVIAVAPRRQRQNCRHRKCRALERAAAGADIRRVRDAGFPIDHLVRRVAPPRHARFGCREGSTRDWRKRSRGRRWAPSSPSSCSNRSPARRRRPRSSSSRKRRCGAR